MPDSSTAVFDDATVTCVVPPPLVIGQVTGSSGWSARSTLVAMGTVIVALPAVTASAAAYPLLLAGMAGVGLVFLVLTAVYSRRHLPEVVAIQTAAHRRRASLERSASWAE